MREEAASAPRGAKWTVRSTVVEDGRSDLIGFEANRMGALNPTNPTVQSSKRRPHPPTPRVLSASRSCVPDLTGGPVLRALQHHDDPDGGRRVQLLQGVPGRRHVLGLLAGLDGAAALRLEQLRPGGSRDDLLGQLDGQDGQQHLLHHLPVRLLPDRAVPGDRVLLREAAVRHQTGEPACVRHIIIQPSETKLSTDVSNCSHKRRSATIIT